MTEPHPRPVTRLRSRHRRFDQRRADRSRLVGSLVVGGLVLVGAVVWWGIGRWQVGVVWAAAALTMAGWEIRSSRDPSWGGTEERWERRGVPGPQTVAVVLGIAAVVLVTLRFGLQRTWGDSLLGSSTPALAPLFFAWRGVRRSRRTSAEGRESPGRGTR